MTTIVIDGIALVSTTSLCMLAGCPVILTSAFIEELGIKPFARKGRTHVFWRRSDAGRLAYELSRYFTLIELGWDEEEFDGVPQEPHERLKRLRSEVTKAMAKRGAA